MTKKDKIVLRALFLLLTANKNGVPCTKNNAIACLKMTDKAGKYKRKREYPKMADWVIKEIKTLKKQ